LDVFYPRLSYNLWPEIRLAGELNKLFNNEQPKGASVSPSVPQPANTLNAAAVKLEDVKNYIGKTVSTQGKVYGSKDIGSMILVNLGAAYPNQLLTIALKGKAKEAGTQLDNKTITVEGEVIDYKGEAEIIVTDLSKIKF
jgi:hypothetical protein